MDTIEWIGSTEIPDVLNNAQNRFSVDVLVYCDKSGEHTIAWYDYLENKWCFLCREVNFKKFKWRYFTDKYDRYGKTDKKRN